MTHSPEQPQSLEARVLRDLGYADVLGKPIPPLNERGGSDVLADNFLDAYPEGSSHRQETEEMLLAFSDMDPSDGDYAFMREHIRRYFEAWFGPVTE